MSNEKSAMRRIATFIVDRRALIILLFAAALVLSVFTSKLTVVVDDLYDFLPEYTETRQALKAMGSDFTTFATAQVMLDNISMNGAFDLRDELAELEGVKSVDFALDDQHYKGSSALFNITFMGQAEDEISLTGLDNVKNALSYRSDVHISSQVGFHAGQQIVNDMLAVGVIAVIIVIVMLLFTSRSFAEVPVLIITFITAAVLQIGTNFVYRSISYISNSVTLILQLALAIDYAVILCNRYTEEHRTKPPREAMITALTKAIPEISASSLTTMGGLLAMTFMEFGLGGDMGKVLIKSILLSMLTVFLLMPGLMMLFARAIDRTRHRSFIPKINRVGQFAWNSRKLVPPLFILLAVAGIWFSGNVQFGYDYDSLFPISKTELQSSTKHIQETFGYSNMMALLVPTGDYDTEAEVLAEISEDPHVTSTLGLAGVDAINGYRLGDKLTFDEFSELAGLDEMSSVALFAYYAARNSDYDLDLHSYKVPLVDLFLFLYDVTESGDLELTEDQTAMIEDLYGQLTDAQLQLQGKHYSRMIIYSDLPVQSEESYALVERIHSIAEEHYGGDVYVAGNTTCARDLNQSFATDNIRNTVLSALFVVLVILFTFRSVGLSVLLIAVIQGSIWINFSVPYFTGSMMYFCAYLVVSAIQMGANIDYAIVVSNRYITLREKYNKRDSVTGAINGALPTLLTSGSILAIAGLLVGLLVKETVSSAIGIALGRGTILSLLIVVFVLPQVLIWGDKFIRKTTFRHKPRAITPFFSEDFEALGRIASDSEPKGKAEPAEAGTEKKKKVKKSKLTHRNRKENTL